MSLQTLLPLQDQRAGDFLAELGRLAQSGQARDGHGGGFREN